MEDKEIVDLYWERNERAIIETSEKYGAYCFSIAGNMLAIHQDCEEVINDTWLGAWNAMPPHRPGVLRTFLGKITRRLSLKKLREKNADKRKADSAAVSLNELEECIPAGKHIDDNLAAEELTEKINDFLETLKTEERRVFICRYWYFDSIESIASRFGCSRGKVKTMLHRTRKKLAAVLEKEGYVL